MVDLKILSDKPEAEAPDAKTLTITPAGAEGVRKYLKENDAPDGAILRIGLRGGGCNGLSYVLEVETAPKDNDNVIDAHGVRVVVDPRSMTILAGTTLDYSTNLMEAGLKFINPRATRTCGCGESFSIS